MTALIARIQTVEMPFHFALGLDIGVTPAALSEVITHLAFYAGWANAMAAVAVAKDIFHQRGIGADQLPLMKDKPPPINEGSGKQRAAQVSSDFGKVLPGLVENTTDLLFRDLWLRPALSPRDRSLIAMSALIAKNQTAQIAYHLGRAMDNGLTQEQTSEVLTHIAFYAGLPCAFGFASGQGRFRETAEVTREAELRSVQRSSEKLFAQCHRDAAAYGTSPSLAYEEEIDLSNSSVLGMRSRNWAC